MKERLGFKNVCHIKHKDVPNISPQLRNSYTSQTLVTLLTAAKQLGYEFQAYKTITDMVEKKYLKRVLWHGKYMITNQSLCEFKRKFHRSKSGRRLKNG